ncbi:MAG: flagellar basal body rod protein FlgC [Phycisphaerales bacterium]|nr:flagellar basal body rod protein FlgC [Phycisphaerales bacterium]
MYGSLDISTSGMIAQRTRMTVIANNIANVNTTQNSKGEYEPYLRRAAMLSPAGSDGQPMGVQVSEIQIMQDALKPAWRPGHPNADDNGNIMVPDIDTTSEWVNGLEASRAYEANVVAAEASKSMMAQALRLLA